MRRRADADVFPVVPYPSATVQRANWFGLNH